jgi:hypothetical protein
MRWLLAGLILINMVASSAAGAAEGRVYKVLPQFLDEKGRHALTPSLYDRDAYQAMLQHNPAKVSGLRFAVQWKAKAPATDQLRLRVEMRGVADGKLPKESSVEMPVQQRHWFSHWSSLVFKGEEYKTFGAVTAWRVTLWDGKELLGEQRSFLW